MYVPELRFRGAFEMPASFSCISRGGEQTNGVAADSTSFQRKGIRSVALAFILGVFSFFALHAVWDLVTACGEHYDLVNPQFLCSDASQYRSEWAYEPLREAVIQKIGDLKQSGSVENMSVYFRDLKNGSRFGFEDNKNYYAASLLKVPIMIAILHVADKTPGFLDKTLSSSGGFIDADNLDQPQETIQPNTSYSIAELLRKMIVFSDNRSAELLVRELNHMPVLANSNTYLDLGMNYMMSGNIDSLSVQSYSNLFAILYNTWYLSDAMSQYALDLLSQSTFKDGLSAGIPSNIRIAQKFGYHYVSDKSSQLHDCGVVYHPVTPYVLCVMTSGTDTKSEANSIATVSRLVYQGVDAMR